MYVGSRSPVYIRDTIFLKFRNRIIKTVSVKKITGNLKECSEDERMLHVQESIIRF